MARLRRRVNPTELIDPLEAAISGGNPFLELVTELIERNINDLEKIREVEKREMFDPKQSPAFCSAFDPGRERHLIAGMCSRRLAEEFEVASKWFGWRGHEELSQRYVLRAVTVHEILSPQEAKEAVRR